MDATFNRCVFTPSAPPLSALARPFLPSICLLAGPFSKFMFGHILCNPLLPRWATSAPRAPPTGHRCTAKPSRPNAARPKHPHHHTACPQTPPATRPAPLPHSKPPKLRLCCHALIFQLQYTLNVSTMPSWRMARELHQRPIVFAVVYPVVVVVVSSCSFGPCRIRRRDRSRSS